MDPHKYLVVVIIVLMRKIKESCFIKDATYINIDLDVSMVSQIKYIDKVLEIFKMQGFEKGSHILLFLALLHYFK